MKRQHRWTFPTRRAATRRAATRNAAALCAAALVLASCGGSDATDTNAAAPVVAESSTAVVPADGENAAAEAAPQTDEEMARAFSSCMRDEGLDFPDPIVAADGAVSFDGAGAQVDPGSTEFEQAFSACGELIEGASFLPGAEISDAEAQDNLLAFAQCLREQGYDVDDPDLADLQAQGPGAFATMFGDNFDPTDPANATVVQLCQAEFGAGE